MPVALGVNGGVLGSNNLPTATTFRGVFTPNEVARAIALGFWPVNKSQAVTGVAGSGALGTLTVGATADPYFEYTTLLLPGNGTNGAQNNTFLDSSTNNFTITRNGNTTQGTFSPFSQTGWGNYFNGSSTLDTSNAAFNPAGAFTIEFWFYGTDSATSTQGLVSTWASGLSPAQGILIWKTGANCEIQIGNASTGGTTIATFTWATYLNQWNHFALVRNSSNSCAVFLNGTRLAAPVTKSGSPGQTALTIGRAFPNSASSYFTGYMSNVSFVSGSNVYDPASSTITVPTTPLSTSTANQALLTCQANRFIDSNTATTAKTITVNGNPSVQAFSPFNPTASWSAATNGGSGYFDGNNDYLTYNASTSVNVGTGDFTIEGWFYTSSFSAAPCLADFRAAATNSPILIEVNTSGFLNVLTGSTRTSTVAMVLNQWNHWAVCRTSGTFELYVNGQRGLSVTDTFNFTSPNTTSKLGQNLSNTSNINGYVSGFRIIKGTALYNAATYTIPTAPPTAITNTSLLLNFTNAGIFDATSKNDLETVGNAQISTTQSKWGGSSMAFDGTGDYLYGPSNNLVSFGTGPFTIEGWVYALATPSDSGFFTNGGAAAGSLGFYFLTGYLRFDIYGGGGFAATTLLPLNQWVHIACVRSGNTVTLYQNGTSVGSSTITDNNTSSLCYVGTKGWDLTKVFNGYMQDVRITKGYARYTSNFTPPTAAFPTL